MKAIIPSTRMFIIYNLLFYWFLVLSEMPITISGKDIGYSGVLILIMLVDYLNRRNK